MQLRLIEFDLTFLNLGDSVVAKGKKKGKRPRGRPKKPKPMMPVVPYPDAQLVPDWTEETINLLMALTVKERSFVERLAAGDSAVQAYRRAYGKSGAGENVLAHRIRHRLDVQAALNACLRDRNVTNRCDREWMLAKMVASIEIGSAYTDVASAEAVTRMVLRMAQLKGQVPNQLMSVAEDEDGGAGPSDQSERFNRLLAYAKGFIRGGQAEVDRLGLGRIADLPRAKVVSEHGTTGGGVPERGG